MSLDAIIDGVLRRELPPGVRWDDARAQLHEADRGGWTRGGITVGAWGEFMGWDRQATRAELDAITEVQARDFYRKKYVARWESVWEPLRTLLVDFAVTSWHDDPARALQRALKQQGLYAGNVDGVAGRQTFAALTAVTDRRGLYLLVLEYRARHYIAVAFDREVRAFLREHPTTQLHNLRGWLAQRCLPFVYAAPE